MRQQGASQLAMQTPVVATLSRISACLQGLMRGNDCIDTYCGAGEAPFLSEMYSHRPKRMWQLCLHLIA